MDTVMENNLRLLASYLAAVGCDKGAVFKIVLDLWDEDAVIEMLQFCRDNPNASQAELLRASVRIAAKYRCDEDEEWEIADYQKVVN